MGKYDWISFKTGKARFVGTLRSWDASGRSVFALESPEGKVSYGEFTLKYAADNKHYSIEILNFGYAVSTDVGAPGGTPPLTKRQIEATRALIVDLMLTGYPDAGRPFPIEEPEWFDGKIVFRHGWIDEVQSI
jgi:hypothetical protein